MTLPGGGLRLQTLGRLATQDILLEFVMFFAEKHMPFREHLHHSLWIGMVLW